MQGTTMLLKRNQVFKLSRALVDNDGKTTMATHLFASARGQRNTRALQTHCFPVARTHPLKLPSYPTCWQHCQGGQLQQKWVNPSTSKKAGYRLQYGFTVTAGPAYSHSLKTEVPKPKHERPPADFPYFLLLTFKWMVRLILSCFETTYSCLASRVYEAPVQLTSLKDIFLLHCWRNAVSYPGNLNTKII